MAGSAQGLQVAFEEGALVTTVWNNVIGHTGHHQAAITLAISA
jgi:hypothetical protein